MTFCHGMVTICFFLNLQMCHSGETCCGVTAFSQRPLVQRHHQAWSHHSDLHSLSNWNKICCGYSRQTVPASLQSDTTQTMLPVPVDTLRLSQQFPAFSCFACSWSHTRNKYFPPRCVQHHLLCVIIYADV